MDAGASRDGVGYDAIVLAGGRARRLGGIDKPGLEIDGSSLLDRVVGAVAAADTVVCVGPSRPTGRQVIWCREAPAGGGPVAALAAGVQHVVAEVVVVLAADLPSIAPAVPVLVSALADAGAAVLVDGSGRANHLAAAWRRSALVTALAALGDPRDAPVRALFAGVDVVEIGDADGWGSDCDTWDDVERARQNVTRSSPA